MFTAALIVCGLVFLVLVIQNGRRWAAEASADETARLRREQTCSEQVPRNARAWAVFMRIKDPAVLCTWEGGWVGCGYAGTCSVGADGAIYGVRCAAGDGEADDGKAERCQIMKGGR